MILPWQRIALYVWSWDAILAARAASLQCQELTRSCRALTSALGRPVRSVPHLIPHGPLYRVLDAEARVDARLSFPISLQNRASIRN
jgi:hypothetical protein